MQNVASVAPVSSSRQSQVVYRVTNPVSTAASARPIQSAGNIQAVANTTSSHSASAATPTDLPMSLLLSVSRPSSSNGSATTDYDAMQSDLRSGNLAAAQQAYLRLQTDLLMTQASSAAAGGSSGLNVTA